MSSTVDRKGRNSLNKKIESILGSNKRPDIDDFYESHTIRGRNKDKKSVKNLEAIFNKRLASFPQQSRKIFIKNKKQIDAIESFLSYYIEMSNWLGETAMTSRPTSYDDYVNGVDVIVEFDTGENNFTRHPGRVIFKIDLTCSASRAIEKIKLNIRRVWSQNNLVIKYFESQVDGFRGIFEGAIPIVIGVNESNLSSLINLHNQFGINRKIEAHSFQILMIEQIHAQISMYLRVCKKKSYGELLDKSLIIIEKAYEEKKQINTKKIKTFDLHDAILEKTM